MEILNIMIEKQEFLINFPKYILTKNFEKFFNNHYSKTILSENQKILFDFSQVAWCDLFELCLITLWINKLKGKNKEIRCKLPSNSKEYGFFEKWEFIKFLRDRSIEIERKESFESKKYSQDDYIQFITFFSTESDFHNFVKSLKDKKRQKDLFKDLYNLDIIHSGIMRDIIFTEIGQNMFDHAKGRGALMAMGAIWNSQKQDKYLPKFEREFFKTLKKIGSSYLQIVICDHGDGFKKVLGPTYEEDESIPINEREKPMELKIIDYAFEKTSTSRKGKPLLEIAEDEDYKALIPPKGLYFVKNLVKEKKGFLSIRSGSTILYYDFLNNSKKIRSNQEDDSLKSIANFRGVQYKLYIPILPSPKKTENTQEPLKVHKVSKTYSFHFISVKDYLIESDKLNLNDIFAEVKKVSNELKDKGIIVLDFSRTDLKKQYLYPLIKKIMFLQEEEKLIIGFNLGDSKGLAETVSNSIIEDEKFSWLREKIFVWLDDRLNMNFIGVEDKYIEMYLDYQRRVEAGEKVKIDDKKLELLLRHSDHFLWYDQQEKRYYEKFQRRDFLKNFVVNTIKTIRKKILDNPNIFHKEHKKKFLIPSVTYTEAFFEINGLYSEFEDRERLISTLAYLYNLKYMDFSTIVTTSGIAGRIAKDFINKIKYLKIDKVEELKHFELLYERPTLGFDFATLQEKYKKILLLTDVVGTTKSIKKDIEKILISNTKLKLEDICIFTIVDARKGEEKDVEQEIDFEGIYEDNFYFAPSNPDIKQTGICKLYSLLKHPIKYHDEKPRDWDYKDIIVIDLKTHSPIEEEQETLKEVTDWRNFLKKYCFDAIILKHLIFDDGTHYNYFFVTNIIAERCKEYIATTVNDDIHDLKRTRIKDEKYIPPNIKVLYSKREINRRIAEAIAEKLNLKPSEDVWDYEEISESSLKDIDAIVFDVAAGTGNTLKKILMDIAKHARIVYVYVMINRIKEFDTSFFEEIKQWAKAEISIKFLMNFELPKYNDKNLCPICKKIEELREINNTTNVKTIKEYIDKEIKNLCSEKITFQEIDKLTPESKELLVEKRIEKIAIRIELEKARKSQNVEIRYETINKYLKNFSTNQDDVFDLFEIISEERYCFEDDFKDITGIFYPDIRERIVNEVCLKALTNDVSYSEMGLKYTLSVLNIFSPEKFLENLILIFKKIVRGNYSEKVSLHFFVEILKALKQGGDRTQIESNLQHCINYCLKKEKLSGVLRELCEELMLEKKGMVVKSIQYLYRQLISPLSPEHTEMIKEFRRFDGFYQTFVRSKDEGAIKNIQSWARRWEKISLEITHIMENAEKMFYGIGVSPPYFDFDPSDQPDKYRPTMQSDIHYLQEIVPKLQEEEDPTVLNRLIVDVSKAVDRINTYVLKNDSPLQEELKGFCPNILEEINAKKKDREERFQQENITVILDLPLSFPNHVRVLLPQSDLANIFGNLFKDSLNHGFKDVNNPAKKITISLEESGEYILIKFADNGKGMSPEEVERIFKKGEEEEKRYWYEGKKVIEKFDGIIRVPPEVDKGTMFEIKLLRG